jgi:hypothetical protein
MNLLERRLMQALAERDWRLTFLFEELRLSEAERDEAHLTLLHWQVIDGFIERRRGSNKWDSTTYLKPTEKGLQALREAL